MRETQSETIDFNLESWLNQWFQMMQTHFPGAESVVDLPGLRTAMLDAAGERFRGVEPEADSEGIELLGDVILDLPNVMPLVVTELLPNPSFIACAQRLAILFYTGTTHAVDAATLRRDRRDALLGFLDLITPILEHRLEQIANNKRKREEYAQRKLPLADVEEFSSAHDPSLVMIAEEAAAAVFEKLSEELSPFALNALRDLLLNPSSAPCCEHAQKHGISAATMSRAKTRFIELAVERLRDAPRDIARPFEVAVERAFTKETA